MEVLLYRVLLYIHVSSAILSVGPFFVLIPIAKKLESAGQGVQQAYIGIFRTSVRLVKHAGHVLVGSGVLLIVNSHWAWTTSWIVATLMVMGASVFFLARAFTPVLKKFDEPGADQHFLVKKLTRSVWIYLFLLMLMLWFMVAKPVLW
ncbi:hypothetical protein [Cytobacillus sp. NCCP-133]|uniref:hypothetical protein n=1 Tax=Cytobacillus sp. NCCP-133 TaxID=766848 RepID=UPI00222FEE28|nr:hypothetical protein [Cytobacillus sp. NCCP-133]GLB61055.1 hypothetical protein NCCP133_31860 [Cytobacillus sp. NCCP-133]